MAELKHCPMCDSARHIRRSKSLTRRIINKNFCCDKCGFHAPRAATWRGARRKWNSYVKVWREGYEEAKPIIMRKLDAELQRRMHELEVDDVKAVD